MGGGTSRVCFSLGGEHKRKRQPGVIGTLHVTVLQANDLAVRSKIFRMDPYAEVTVNNVKGTTQIVKKGHKTPFFGETLEFPLLGGTEDCVISLWASSFFRDSHIGSVTLTTEEMLDKVGSGTEEYKLVHQDETAGTIELRFDYIPPLTVTLHKAIGLRDASVIGSQDPFVHIRYGKTEFKGPVCKGGGTNPEWDSPTVDFIVPKRDTERVTHSFIDPDGDVDCPFEIEVVNYNRMKNDLLGSALVKLADLVAHANKGRFTIELRHGKPDKDTDATGADQSTQMSGKPAGQLELSVHVSKALVRSSYDVTQHDDDSPSEQNVTESK